MRRSPRRRSLLVLLAGALGASALVLPAAAQDGRPSVATQQALVQAADGTVVTLDVTDRELAGLRVDPEVGPVLTRGRTAGTALAQSVPKVGAPTLWSEGYRGAGKVIVVIDTGVATTFGGTLVGQACFAATQLGSDLTGHCGPAEDEFQAFSSTCFTLGVCDATNPDYYVLDEAAGRPCPEQPDDCAHGTAVAAVAARHEPTPGVAPDAGVYVIRVFDPSGSTADLFDIRLALDHARQLSDAGMDIAAVNLSVSTSDSFAGHCDLGPAATDEAVAFRQAFDQLKGRGIGNAVASGNDYDVGGIGLPACVSSAVAVGATDLDDDLADFGNRGPSLDLVAPGADEGNGPINYMDIPGNPVVSWAGTSFSAPHVAGAFALLEPRYPKASVNQLVGLLRDTGVPVSDPTTGASYRRLNLANLDAGLAAGLLFPSSAGVTGAARTALGDLDGDGRADVLTYGPGSGPDSISFGRTTWGFDRRALAVGGDFQPLFGQLRGSTSGPEDVLWYAPGSAADWLWIGQAGQSHQTVSISVTGTYSPVVGDFDGDGWDDVLWYAPGGTADPIWFGGTSGFAAGVVDIRGTYSPLVGDFDGDGRQDLLLYGTGSSHAVWFGTSTRSFAKTTVAAPGSRRAAVGDLNGNLRDDIVLHGPGTSSDLLLLGSAGRSFTTRAMTVRGTYQLVIADLDRDGRDDILWYAPGPSADPLWSNVGSGVPVRRYTTSISGTYEPFVGDLDGDSWDDLVWANAASAVTPVWWSYVAPEG